MVPKAEASPYRWLTLLVIAALMARGLAYLVLLPPLEGFDESTHYSYIAQLADEGTIPDFRSSRIDAAVETVAARLPTRYADYPPYEKNGALTFVSFQQLSAEDRQARLDEYWRPSRAAYAPGQGLNWQGQHPPLYYALMTLPYRATRHASMGVRLLVLRMASALVVLLGALFWRAAVLSLRSKAAATWLLLAGVAVVWMPALDHDLFRIGNDSMVSAAFAAAMWLAIRGTLDGNLPRWRWFVGLGLTLGAGLLSKLTFVPISAGLMLVVAWGLWRAGVGVRPATARLLLTLGLAVLVAGGWYWLAWQRYGSPLMDCDGYKLLATAQATDLTASQLVRSSLRAIVTTSATFQWVGSWSCVHLPLWLYGLPLLYASLALWGLMKSIREERDFSWQLVLALGLVPLGAVVGGLIYVKLKRVFWTGHAIGWGGYYLYSLWPALGLALAGAWTLWKTPAQRCLLGLALGMLVGLEVTGFWFLTQVYAGQVAKLGAEQVGQGMTLPTPHAMSSAFTALRGLCFPETSLIALAVSLLLRLAIVGQLGLALESGRPSLQNTPETFD